MPQTCFFAILCVYIHEFCIKVAKFCNFMQIIFKKHLTKFVRVYIIGSVVQGGKPFAAYLFKIIHIFKEAFP